MLKNKRLIRLLQASGPISSAISTLFLTLTVIPLVSKSEYGFLAFCLAVTVFSNSVINALAATPLSILLNQTDQRQPHVFWPVVKISLTVSTAISLILAALGLIWNQHLPTVSLLSVYGFLNGLRWIQRSYQYATHQPGPAATADAVSAIVMILGSFALYSMHMASLLWPSVLLVVSTVIGIAIVNPMRSFADYPLSESLSYPLSRFSPIWRSQSRWALLGVITTEMTVNGHVYVVTALSGPSAYSIIAIATLVWRPVMTISTALTQIERPRLAKAISKSDHGEISAVRSHLFAILTMTYIVNAASLPVAFYFFQEKLHSKGYNLASLLTSVILWSIVILVRTIRTRGSLFLQATKRFRELSFTSLYAAPFSLGLTSVMTIFWGPVFSIIGIIVGECLMTRNVEHLLKGEVRR